MNEISSYALIISATIIIILSYFFNRLAQSTKLPSVLMLIGLGVGLQYGLKYFNINLPNITGIVEVLGIIGLIMIVLEASIDLELKKDKTIPILKAFGMAFCSLALTSYFIALILEYFIKIDIFTAFLYSIPLSIISSAIVIPSTGSLEIKKKEFLIYESAFSDILGIMFFYFLINSAEFNTTGEIVKNISGSIIITIVISALVGYILVYVFQKIKSETKLFLLISVLILLYSIGKLFELSPLILILFFGLILKNYKTFFVGKLKRFVKTEEIKEMYKDFSIVTAESAFVVRTFFFVFFGLSITISSIIDLSVLISSSIILLIIYGVRWLNAVLFLRKEYWLETLISPRGLITVLLFYSIPEQYSVPDFESGILLMVILVTSGMMAFSLIKFGKPKQIEIATEEEKESIIEIPNSKNTESEDSINELSEEPKDDTGNKADL